jgi:hypothetical protein
MPNRSSGPFNCRMRILLGTVLLALGVACATHEKKPDTVTTHVVTFPDGALIQYNGTNIGRAPAKIVLPQEQGKLTARAEVRAIPNTYQTNLFVQSRIFDPETRYDQVPNRIMIDMTLHGPYSASLETVAATTQAEPEKHEALPRKLPYHVERSKPTQAVGLDRWNAGKQ